MPKSIIAYAGDNDPFRDTLPVLDKLASGSPRIMEEAIAATLKKYATRTTTGEFTQRPRAHRPL